MQSYKYIEVADLVPHGPAAGIVSQCYINKGEITLQGDFLVTITYDRKPNQEHPLFTLKSGQLLYQWRGSGSWRGFGLPIMGQVVTLSVKPTPAQIAVELRNVPEADRKLFFAGCRYPISRAISSPSGPDDVYWTVHSGIHMSTNTDAKCQGNFATIYATRPTTSMVRDLTPGEASALRMIPELAAGAPEHTRFGPDMVVTEENHEYAVDSWLRTHRDHNRLPPWTRHEVRTRIIASDADQFQRHSDAIAALLTKYAPAAAEAQRAATAATIATVQAGRAERIERAIGTEASQLWSAACAAAAAPPAPTPTPFQGTRGRPVPSPKAPAAPALVLPNARRQVVLPPALGDTQPTFTSSVLQSRRARSAPRILK